MLDTETPPVPANPFVRLRVRGVLIPWVLLLLGAGIIAELVPEWSGALGSIGIGGTITYGLLALVLARRARRTGLSWPRLFGPPLSANDVRLLWVVLPVAAVSLGSFTLFWGPISYLIPDIVERIAEQGMPEILTPGDPARMAIEAFVVVILAPVMEEILFRGILFHRWATRWGLRTGIILSSLAFGVVHVEPVGHFAFGVVMCALYLTTGSLWAPIAAHALNNGLVVIIMLPAALRGETPQSFTLDDIRSDWGIAVALVAVGLIILIHFARQHLQIRYATLPYLAWPVEGATQAGAPGSF
jgi:uncharacterized protein